MGLLVVGDTVGESVTVGFKVGSGVGARVRLTVGGLVIEFKLGFSDGAAVGSMVEDSGVGLLVATITP